MNRNRTDKIEQERFIKSLLNEARCRIHRLPLFSSYVRPIDLFRSSCTSVWRLGIASSRRSRIPRACLGDNTRCTCSQCICTLHTMQHDSGQGLERARCDVIDYLRERRNAIKRRARDRRRTRVIECQSVQKMLYVKR